MPPSRVPGHLPRGESRHLQPQVSVLRAQAGAPDPTLSTALTCPLPPAWVVQDVADFEWVMWFTSFRNIIVFALSGHVLFAKLCTMVAPQVSRSGALGLLLPAPP